MPWPPARRACSHRDPFVVGSRPAPGARAVTTLQHPLLVDLGDDLAVSGEQGFGGTHLGAKRELPFEKPVRAVFLVFLDAARRFRATTARAEGAFVHLAARPEIADAWVLW